MKNKGWEEGEKDIDWNEELFKKLAEGQKEIEKLEAERRSKPATIGDIEDAIESLKNELETCNALHTGEKK